MPWPPTSTGDVIRRDFDVSRVGDEQQRINLARRYVETTDKIHQLDGHLRLLETARKSRPTGKTNSEGR